MPGVRFSAKMVDQGLKDLRKTLLSVKQRKSYVKAGVVGQGAEAQRGDGITMGALAAIHEFGAPSVGVPQRSFIRSTFDHRRPAYIATLAKLLEQVYENRMPIEKALGVIGLMMATDMKRYITTGSGVPPPLRPATIAAKLAKGSWKRRRGEEGPAPSPRPLVDTGRLLGAITYEVVMAGGD